MKAEFINQFMQGAQNVLSMICNEQTSLGKVYVKAAPYTDDMSIAVGLTGNLKGEIVYTMKHSMACYLASKMMMGMPVSEIDDMARSALSELANMISGTSATLFSGLGIITDITPPKFIDGAAALNSSVASNKLMVIPLIFKNSEVFEINVWIDD